MYRISTRGQYALLIMSDLAENPQNLFIPLKTLSHRRNLSVKYLEQILIQLGKAGLVTGSRGMNGGYKLSKPARDYTVGDILRAMEGDLSPRESQKNSCLESPGTETFWKKFSESINGFVDSVTLEQLAKENEDFVGYEFCI